MKNRIRILLHGSDSGSALLTAVILLLVFSILYLSFASRVAAMKKNTAVYREQVFSRIQKENDEVMRKHDLH